MNFLILNYILLKKLRGFKMIFFLFSKISFEIPDPIALIECYCYQNDFYSKYDLLEDKKIEDVNKIGARIKKEVLLECKIVTKRTKSLNIFEYNNVTRDSSLTHCANSYN